MTLPLLFSCPNIPAILFIASWPLSYCLLSTDLTLKRTADHRSPVKNVVKNVVKTLLKLLKQCRLEDDLSPRVRRSSGPSVAIVPRSSSARPSPPGFLSPWLQRGKEAAQSHSVLTWKIPQRGLLGSTRCWSTGCWLGGREGGEESSRASLGCSPH